MDDYSFRETYHDLVRSEIFPLLPQRIDRLLDVGGGIGATAAEIKRRWQVAHAGVVDIVDAEQPEGPHLDFRIRADLEDTDHLKRDVAKHGPFDVVLLLDILEHLRDPWRLVSDLSPLVAANGLMIASIPNVRHYKAVVPLVTRGAWDYKDAGILDRTHLRFFGRRSAIDLMTSSGMHLEDVRETGLKPYNKKYLFDRATFGVFRPFLVLQYLVCVRKPQPQA